MAAAASSHPGAESNVAEPVHTVWFVPVSKALIADDVHPRR